MRRAAVVTTLALAATLAIGGARASAAVPRSFYGIVPLTSLTGSDFQRMGAARVGTLRFQMLWSNVQPTHHGGFNFTATDQTVALAAQQHITLLPVLAGTPAYESGGCTSQDCSRHIEIGTAAKRSDWKDFVTVLVNRYGPNGDLWQQNPGLPYDPIREWQIWNEQNAPNQKDPPSLYAKLLALTDKAISPIDPGAKIVLGGMFGTPKGSKKFSAWNYLGALYKHGAKRHFDAAALHPYSPVLSGLKTQIKNMRRVMKAHHDPKAKLLITEIGWGSSKKKHPGTGSLGAQFNVGLKPQAKKLTQSFKLLTSHRKRWKIGGVVWFTWKDPLNPPPGLCAFCYSSGLYHADGQTAKPALRAYKRFTRRTR
jgi:hypothetical protein